MSHSLFSNLAFNILIPVVIMTKFGDAWGAVFALVIALLFPFCYGLWDWYKEKSINGYSALGIVSVLLTGFIGVLELPAQYLAIKEAAVPLLVGLFFFLSSFTRFDATEKFLGTILDIKKVQKAYAQKKQSFTKPLRWVRFAFIASFVFSAVANYLLAIVIVTAEPATPEFTAQIGKMTALSFPVIVLPILIVFIAVIYFLFWHIEKTTKQKHDVFVSAELAKK